MLSNFKTYPLFRPLSWLYGLGVNLRNKLFDIGVLKQKKFDVPVICVGNITAGGTGKTPHIEYLIHLLSPLYKVAVVSRGYMRKSKGFRLVEAGSTAHEVGDEPLHIKQKYPNTLVVVDTNRANAIEKILSFEKEKRPDVVLLDDGFQHRYVQPLLSILLVNSHRPVFEDKLLPAGLLREPLQAKNRADIVLVTKCENNVDVELYKNKLSLQPHQQLYFTTFGYEMIAPVFPDLKNVGANLCVCPISDLQNKHILLITGIASPQPLVEKLQQHTNHLHTLFFPDHHFFSEKDIDNCRQQFNAINDANKLILTTEKDAVRFRTMSCLSDEMKKMMYYIPIRVKFVEKWTGRMFNNEILKCIDTFFIKNTNM